MKKKLLVSILMATTILGCVGFTGCGKSKPTSTKPVEKVQKVEQKNTKMIADSVKFETKEKTTCYRKLSKQGTTLQYYKISLPIARDVIKFTTNYMKLGENVDYKTIKKDNQFSYYSERLQKEYGGLEACNQDAINSAKKTQFSQKFLGTTNYEKIEFNKDFTTCKVSVFRLVMFNNFSKDSPYAKGGVKLNTVYEQKAIFDLICENGNWKVDKEDYEPTFHPFHAE